MYRVVGIFIVIFIIGVVFYFTCSSAMDIQVFDSGRPGKNILLLGGTHGNEPAGRYVLLILQKLLNRGIHTLKSGKITIIHNVNPCGYYFNNRYYNSVVGNIDINRLYGKNFPINNKIEKLVKLNDIILDFHEGWGYIRQNTKSVGSSITCSKIPIKYQNDIIKKINSSITEDYKLWNINTQKSEIMHSLRDFAIDNKKAYMLIETSGQNNIQPLDVRVSQNITIITYILKKYRIL